LGKRTVYISGIPAHELAVKELLSESNLPSPGSNSSPTNGVSRVYCEHHYCKNTIHKIYDIKSFLKLNENGSIFSYFYRKRYIYGQMSLSML